jgi:SAM-dependent methyltransferase
MKPKKIDLICLVCSNKSFKPLFKKNDRQFWRCTSCGYECQHPLPSETELRDYYDSSYEEGMYREFVAAAEMKTLTAKSRFQQVRPYLREGRLLDVGCSDGRFVEYARSQGLDAEGIDISKVAVEIGRRRGIPLQVATIESHHPSESYVNITAFDVLEHVLSPAEFLSNLLRLLEPGGVCALCIPNVGGLMRKLMGKRWYFYIPEEHLHFFGGSTIKTFASNVGFTDVQCFSAVKPMTLDYALTQFSEYNPAIYSSLNLLSRFIPSDLRQRAVPLRIGEIMVTMKKPTTSE